MGVLEEKKEKKNKNIRIMDYFLKNNFFSYFMFHEFWVIRGFHIDFNIKTLGNKIKCEI